MKKTIWLLALLAGCASYSGAGLQPGASMDEVRRVMGQPAAERAGPDGAQMWEYPRASEGWQTYMASFGPDGKLRGIRQAKTPENIRAIKPGQSRDDILRLLGTPRLEQRFPNLAETVWEYRYLDHQIFMVLEVHFDDNGRVRYQVEMLDPAAYSGGPM